MDVTDGLVFAYILDGKGGGRAIGWDEIKSWGPSAGLMWVHLDYTGRDSSKWLEESAGVNALTFDVLVSDDPRPRTVSTEDSLLVILRGVNMNPGADPEDMVSVRGFITPDRVITLRRRRVIAVDDIQRDIEDGFGPKTPGEFVVELSRCLMDRMGTVVAELDDSVDELEDEVLTAGSYELRTKIAMLRRQAIALRRYVAPQRDVLARLQMERVSWLGEMEKLHLREVADRTTRFVEDLDSARERASVTHEELDSRLAEQMNRTMYMLSIVATIFLPLSFLTGLLGINVGGIPGSDDPLAFWVVCGVMAAIALASLIVFKRKRWL